MFKNLKKRLSGFERKLEDQLSDQIERELDEARATSKRTQEPEEKRPAPEAPAREPQPEVPEVPEEAAPPDPPAEPVPERPEPDTPAEPEAEAGDPGAAPEEPPEPDRPRTYKDAKKRGLEEEAARKKETIEERLERELTSAAQMQTAIEKTVGEEEEKILLDEESLEDLLWELEIGMLESDVAMPVIEAIKSSVREQLAVTGVPRRDPGRVVEAVLRTAVRQVLEGNRIDFDTFIEEKLEAGEKPVVIMFVGVNGTGKTTTIAKIAHRLREQGRIPVLAAGDTFRAGAIEQLTMHAEKLGVTIVKHKAGSDPAAVAFDAIEHARSRRKDVVLLDTAGRMQTNTNLMDEMAKIKRVARPAMILFVGDALAGNDAVEQAREFNKVVGVDGAVLTKVDADAKGGAALSVAYTIGKPLVFVGTGQGYDDQVPFDADWMIERLFSEDGVEAAA